MLQHPQKHTSFWLIWNNFRTRKPDDRRFLHSWKRSNLHFLSRIFFIHNHSLELHSWLNFLLRNVVTQNTVTKSFIHGLNHISTQNCHAQYDSAGTLTAIPYVSHTTKKVIYYTFNHCQARISDFFSLNWVFMVTFIYKNPSGDYWYSHNFFCG